MKREVYYDRQEVLLEDVNYDQAGRIADDSNRLQDHFSSGILKDPNGLSNFTVTVDGTTNTLVNVGIGKGYANGFRVAISSNQAYTASNPYTTTNGICTPQSTGNRGVPLVNYGLNAPNYIWVEYVNTVHTTPFSLDPIGGNQKYTEEDDGYRVYVSEVNPPGNPVGITNSVFVGKVLGQGSGNPLIGTPAGLTDVGREYVYLIPADSIGTDQLQDRSVTPQKVDFTGNFAFEGACFTTLIASSNTTIPIQPFLPTSAASKKFAQYAGFGIATSKTIFYPRYDGFDNIIDVQIRGDSFGLITPAYDGLCNIINIAEVIDSRTVSHHIEYTTVNGSSQIYSIEELGI